MRSRAAAGALACSLAWLRAEAIPDSLSLLQWNPHWQCVVWDTNNCTEEAGKALVDVLEREDVDFANLVEYNDPSEMLPANWSSIRSAPICGKDSLDLIYNNVRWFPVIDVPSLKGCMQLTPPDRPYVLQEFEAINGSERVILIAAHFPHPTSYNDRTKAELEVLRDSLRQHLLVSATTRVLLIADTNEFDHTSNWDIMRFIGVPPGPIVGTDLRASCCYDNDFPSWTTFDRVIANFGAGMETTMLFDPVPEWGKEEHNLRRGAFHKAILGTLYVHEAPVPRKRLYMFLLSAFVVVVALIGAAVLLRAVSLRGGKSGYRPTTEEDSSESGSDVGAES